MKVSSKLMIVFVLALVLLFAFTTVASAAGASECGADFGALHKFLATEGLTGRVHFPGIDHTGAAGICGVGIGR
jgi:hypothetical protein